MVIGIPFNLSFQNSNVTDPVQTLDDLLINCQAPVFQEGLELQSGEWIYEYNDDYFIPKIWSQADADRGVYKLDEILLKDCKLIKVTGKSGTGITTHRRPKEPENYSCHETTMDYKSWKCRYVKVSSKTQCNWLTKKWSGVNKQYTIVWCPQINSYEWTVRDTRTTPQCGIAYFKIKRSSKYSAASDIRARIIQWGGYGLSRKDTIQIKSMVERKGYFYLRTTVNAVVEYHTWNTGTAFSYTYGDVDSPADIDGFIQVRRLQAHNPFDGKNYTATEFDTKDSEGYARWDMLAVEEIDSIALGRVICDTVDFRISDQDGNSLFELNSYPIDNTIAKDRPEVYPTTTVLYTDKTYPAGSVITIWLYAALVKVGELIGASKLEAGFTKLNFRNNFKDFSPKEQDQWGNWYYIDGIRVHTHSGTVEYPVVSYDQLNRLMIMIGGRKVVVNSSDSTKNEVPDGRKVFAATMMIARFTKFQLATSEKNKRIGETATYTFDIEEIV